MAELWDLYDLHGNLTEEKYVRDSEDPFPQDRYHIVVEIYTIHRGELLLTKRDARKPFGGLWEYTGGSVVAGEDSRTGASRDLAEETGIVRDPSEFLPISSLLRIARGGHLWRMDAYAMIIPDSEPRPEVIYQEGETVDHIWLERGTADAFIASPAFVGHAAKRYRIIEDTLWKLAEMRK